MTADDPRHLYIARFNRYVDDVASVCDIGKGGLELKRRHTLRVMQEAENLARSLRLAPRPTFLISLAALFHDLGRFEQIRRFNTLSDRRSFNHARESLRVLRRLNLLSALAPAERRLVAGAILLHNFRALPGHLKPELLLAAGVLRDADKLDIVSVILSYLEGEEEPDTDVFPNMDRDPKRYTPALVDSIRQKQVVSLGAVTCANDFLLLLSSWVYDLNFAAARAGFEERNYLGRIFAHLPASPRFASLLERLSRDLASGRDPVCE
jgi:putative nucleotidyltransferase with HDIG domain